MPTMSEAKCFISCWQSASVCVHLNWQIRMWLSAVLCVLNLTDSCSFISLFRWHTKQTPAHSGTLQSCWSAYQQMWGCYLYLYMYSSSHVQCTHTSTNTPCTCTCCIIQCQFLSHPTACICMSYPLPLAFVGLLLDRQLTDSKYIFCRFMHLCDNAACGHALWLHFPRIHVHCTCISKVLHEVTRDNHDVGAVLGHLNLCCSVHLQMYNLFMAF